MEESVVTICSIASGQSKARHDIRSGRLWRCAWASDDIRLIFRIPHIVIVRFVVVRGRGHRHVVSIFAPDGIALTDDALARRVIGLGHRRRDRINIVLDRWTVLVCDDHRFRGQRKVLLEVRLDVVGRPLERIGQSRSDIRVKGLADFLGDALGELGLRKRADEQFAIKPQQIRQARRPCGHSLQIRNDLKLWRCHPDGVRNHLSQMPASALAASPRRFVRLIGMNSSRWPRGISEDRLISDHIIPTAELDPLPVGAADRRDFETILATTSGQIVMSRARRDSEGRLLGRSALLSPASEEIYIRRNAVPAHAFSETDRLMARPDEFARDSQAISATTAWRNWHRKEITPHDGLVRADHPLLQAILGRTQSASSLRLLLRSPLGFVWRYGMRLRTPESGADPLVLDALAMGDLVHMTLDLALATLEKAGGLAAADEAQIAGAVQDAAARIAVVWENERAVPPALIWRRTLDDARILTTRALTYGDEHLPDARSFGEVAFGGATPKADAASPWDSQTPVEIPATGFRIAGYIDRLDIAGDGKRALVRDYKTGRPPKDDISLDGGRELQRCLYAFAVKALLGDDVSISASLLFPRDQVDFQLGDPEATLTEITGYLQAARTNLQSGQALIGPDTGGTYDDLAFALPANAGATYCKRKLPAATEAFGDAALVWEAQ